MNFRFLILPLFATLFFTACSDDDSNAPPVGPDNTVTLTNIVPTAGPIGTVVELEGSNYGTDRSEMHVTLGDEAVVLIELENTRMTFMVPASRPIGETLITLQKNDGKIRTAQFFVEDPIVRKWTAEGDDIAPVLYDVPTLIRKIDATFKIDPNDRNKRDYIIIMTDSLEQESRFIGVYNTDDGGAAAPKDKIRTLVLSQSIPGVVSYEGIYEVTVVSPTAISMKYEMVMTDPPQAGITPPTPEGGFGSTGGSSGMGYVTTFRLK